MSASVGEGDRWTAIGTPNGITIPLQMAGSTTTVHGEASVPSSSDSRVRLVFQGVSARLARGSGGGHDAGDATIILGGSDERVEMSVPVSSFAVEADSRVRQVIVFDMRSQQWVSAAALQSGRVEDAVLQAAVTATTRVENR